MEERDGTIYLYGTIDEEAKLNQILAPKDGTLRLNLAGIKRINSYGVRQWILTLQSANFYIHFVECPEVMIEQANMITNFLSRGKVISFYAPYNCPRCNSDVMKLFKLDEDFKEASPDNIVPPKIICDKCSCEMALDQDENEYFLFLKEHLGKDSRKES